MNLSGSMFEWIESHTQPLRDQVAALRAQLAEAEQQRDASAVAAGVLGESLDTARAQLAADEAQRDRLDQELRVWRGCPACGEDHSEGTICPPHETRVTGSAWTKRQARQQAARAEEAEQEVARLREALAEARHSLVTLNGLTASDGLGAYGAALSEGCDANGAWDCYVEETWQIDETALIARIDAAATRVLAPAAATPPEPDQTAEIARLNATNHKLLDRLARIGDVEKQADLLHEQRDLLQGSLAESKQENARLQEALEWIGSWDDAALAAAKTLHYDMRGRARAALATTSAATPTPDPLDLCECGHGKQLHRNVGARCGMWNCGCDGFTPKQRGEAV